MASFVESVTAGRAMAGIAGNTDKFDRLSKPMPLTLQAGESNVGRPSVSDVVVVKGFPWKLGAAGSFGHAGARIA
jgi:hypothetical protein